APGAHCARRSRAPRRHADPRRIRRERIKARGGCVRARGALVKISNPADGTVISEVTADNATAVRRKYELARAGQPKWAKVPLKKRLATIANFRERVVAMHETLARTLTHEVGKPIRQSRNELNR